MPEKSPPFHARLAARWQWLIEPPASIHAPDTRRRARLLAAYLCVTGLFVALIPPLLPLQAGHSVNLFGGMNLVALPTLAGFGVAFFLNRRGYYRSAAVLTVAVVALAPYLGLIVTQNQVLLMPLLVAGVLLSSVLLSLRATVWVTLLTVCQIISLAVWIPVFTLQMVWAILNAFSVIAFFALANAYYHRQGMMLIEQQARALQADKDYYAALIERADDVVMVVNPDLTYRYLSPAVQRVAGYAPAELIGKSIFDFVHPDDAANVAHAIQERVEIGGLASATMEARARHRNGEYRLYELQGNNLLDHPAVRGMVVRARDITERKRAEQERESRAREFATLHEITSDLAGAHDLEVLLRTIVERAAHLLRAPTGDIYLFDARRQELEFAIAYNLVVPDTVRLKLGEGMAGRVARDRVPMRVEDYSQWEHRAPQFAHIPFRAVAQVPMLYRGELVGVLAVNHLDTAGSFTAQDLRLLALFAAPAAGAVYSARLFAETRRRAVEFETLYEIASDCACRQDSSGLLQAITERAVRLLKTTRGSILLYRPEQNDLVRAATTASDEPRGSAQALEEGVGGRVAQTRQPMIVNDYQNWAFHLSGGAHARIAATVAVPMLYADTLVGVLGVIEELPSARRFDQADVRLLALLAQYAAAAVYNARAFEREERARRDAQALESFARRLNARLDLPTVLRAVCEETVSALGVSAASVRLFDAERQDYRLVAALGLPAEYVAQVAPVSRTFFGEITQTDERLVVIPDARNLTAGPNRDLHRQFGIRTILVGALEREGDAFGRLNAVMLDNTREFTDAERALFRGIADQAAVAIQNARLFASEARARRDAEALAQIAAELNRDLNLDAVANAVSAAAARALDVPYAVVDLLDAQADSVHYQSQFGFPAELAPRLRHVPHPFVRGLVQPGDSVFYVPDVRAHPDFPNAAVFAALEARSILAAPITRGEQVIGYLAVFSRGRVREFSAAERLLLQGIAAQAASAIQNARRFDETQASRERLSSLAHQVILAQEQERQRVSRELHDEAGQSLTALLVGLSLIEADLPRKPAALRQQIAQVIDLAESTLKEIRRLAQNLRPPALDTASFDLVLQEYCANLTRHTRLAIDFSAAPIRALDDDAKTTLYRFLQETLTNVLKHARATRVAVALQDSAGAVTLAVQDDGAGIERRQRAAATAPTPRGIGLIGIAERLKLLGGTLTIDSRPGAGTRVCARIPVEFP